MMKKGTGIYIHIPFCVSKCVYCDFLSAPPADDDQIKRYISSLAEEIRSRAYDMPDDLKKADSVFFGGGTPSILPAGELIFILDTIRDSFSLSEDAEITLECNPGTVDEDKLNVCKKAGFNRLSFGVQSTSNKELALLGRIHTFRDFIDSYSAARQAGFANVNTDIMYAIPGQNLTDLEITLKLMITLLPEHISLYSLILEEGTYLYDNPKKFPPLPSEEEEAEMTRMAQEILSDCGYTRYEISNYCNTKRRGELVSFPQKNSDIEKKIYKDYRCRHNLGYWDRAPYFGFGIGAASFDGKVRYKNITDISDYINSEIKEDFSKREILTKKDAMAEFMFLGFRKTEGVKGSDFFDQFGSEIEKIYGKVLNKHILEGVVRRTKWGYALTDWGTEVSNVVLSDYLF